VVARSIRRVPVGTDGDRVDARRMRAQAGQGLAVGRVPEAHGPVTAAAGKDLAIRAERDAADRADVPCEREKQLAIGGVPELDGTVLAGARQLAAVWAEGDGVYRVRMGKFLERTARWNVPDFGGFVGGAGRQHLPVGAN